MVLSPTENGEGRDGVLPWTLGIETSCDESAVAVLDGAGRIEVNLLSSQVAAHAPYGGVVPELASREHLKALPWLVERVLADARETPELVAVTAGPGLIGALLVGVRFAAAYSWARRVPLVAVDHLEGHLLSPFLDLEGGPARPVPRRVLALVASGGHSSWFRLDAGTASRLSRTRDDAAGESFDKVAQVLGLGYPGGPEMDRLARSGDPGAVALPRPRLKDSRFDFSFSGLKSAAVRWIREQRLEGAGPHRPGSVVADLAASFEAAVVDQLLAPLEELIALHRPDLVTASGGVAANTLLRERLRAAGEALAVEVLLPPRALTTDNAAMIAHAGQLAANRGIHHDERRLDAWASSSWQPPGMRRLSSAGRVG
jgi:N6-L-threonylcarbamoyladenine synthase